MRYKSQKGKGGIAKKVAKKVVLPILYRTKRTWNVGHGIKVKVYKNKSGYSLYRAKRFKLPGPFGEKTFGKKIL